MSLLSLLTVIVPTFERQHLLNRSFLYWSSLPVTAIFLDGSRRPFLTASNSLPRNITYVHSADSIYERIRSAVKLVTTDYVLLVSDDEYFLPDALELCLRELEACPELLACNGHSLSFSQAKGKTSFGRAYRFPIGYSVLHERATDRVAYALSTYQPAFIYSVVRKDAWCLVMDNVTKREYSAYAMMELHFTAALTFLGPVKTIPTLSWMRNAGETPVRNTGPSLDESNHFIDWWLSPVFEKERDEFIEGLSHFARGAGGDFDVCRASFKRAFDKYVEKYGAVTIKRRIIVSLPRFIIGIVRPFYRLLLIRRSSTAFASLCAAVEELRREGISVSDKDVRVLRQVFSAELTR